MVLLPRVEHAVELLDSARHDGAELEESLGQVAAVNRWLGGRRSLLAHVDELLPPSGAAATASGGATTAPSARPWSESSKLNSHSPFKFSQSRRTNCGRGYSGRGIVFIINSLFHIEGPPAALWFR